MKLTDKPVGRNPDGTLQFAEPWRKASEHLDGGVGLWQRQLIRMREQSGKPKASVTTIKAKR
jgi:hypothetical protein